VKNVPAKFQGEPSGGHLGANKTLDKVMQRYYWLHARNNTKKWCQYCGTCAASCHLQTKGQGLMHQYARAPFKVTATYVAGLFPQSNQENRYLVLTMDYFTKWPKAYIITNQEASTVAEALVTNFFCHFGVLQVLHSDQGVTLGLTLCRICCNTWM
jgi:ferredoxin